MSAAPVQDGLPTPQRYWAMAAILLGISLSTLDATIVNLALPDITRDFGATASASVWVVNAYQLAVLALLLPCAQLGDRLGYRRIYMTGLVVFTIASLACGISHSLPMLAAARAVQGLGAAGMMSVNSALVRLTYPSGSLGRAVALNSVVVAASSVAGPSFAAVILSISSWPWLFVVQLPIGVILWWIGRRSLPGQAGSAKAPKLSPLDVVLNMLMFVLMFLGADVLGARSSGRAGAGFLPAAGLLLGAIVVAFVYIRRQRREAAPLFPVDLLRIPVFALSMCTSITAFGAQTLAFIALPFILLEGQGRSHLEAGMLITAWPAAIVVAAPIAGRLIHRVSGGLLGSVGQGVLAAGLALLALLPDQPSTFNIAWRLVVCGIGFGLFQSPNNHTIITSAPLRRAGAASGMLGSARLTGQSLGAVLFGIIFSFAGLHHGGATIALGVSAGMAAASAVFSLLRVKPQTAAAMAEAS